jgi:spore coat protein A, manganese oxidase
MFTGLPLFGHHAWAQADTTSPNVFSELTAPMFAVRLPLLPTARAGRDATTDYFSFNLKPTKVEIIPGYRTTVWAFDGRFPGPTIRVQRGRAAVVRQRNQLPEAISVHLHGGHVAPQDDGHPADLVRPGHFKDYFYPNTQPGATLWYHDHAVDATAPHVYAGLAGVYVIEDPAESALGLPRGTYDIPLVIQDRAFAADGSLLYPGISDPALLMTGFLGDTLLVNGAPWPYAPVAARKYRFRILNASNARHYMLMLSNGQPFTLIGTDGGLLPTPLEVPVLSVAPAERVEAVVDFAGVGVGASVVLQNMMGTGRLAQVLRFDVVSAEYDDSYVPGTLRPIEALDPAQAVVTRDWVLDLRGDGNRATWVINGRPFNERRIDARPQLNTVEIWRFTNPSPMMHPMHVHDVMFQVLDRDGLAPEPTEQGWKDTIHVEPGQTVRVIARFTDYRGVYVFHCHNLEHEDRAMMSQFEVV